ALPATAALPGTGTGTAAVTVVTSGTITGATDTTAATGARITGTTVITTTGTTGTTAGTDTGGPAERTQPCHTNALVRTSPPTAGSAGRCAARQW
ncbi:MAG: hypothetical protein WAK71_09680, partial [Streptosporangiaceae bacterium]